MAPSLSDDVHFHVLVLNQLPDPTAERILRSGGAEIECVPAAAASMPDVDDALLARATALVLRAPARASATLLARMPRLKVIATLAAGVDNIDVDAATALGILVVNCPGAGTQAVAEHALGLMLGVARKLHAADAELRSEGWSARDRHFSFPVLELAGKTVGVVGLGSIGSRLAEMCRLGLGMQVCAYSPTSPQQRFDACGAHRVQDVESLCAKSDFVVLCASATAATRGIVAAAQLAAMRPGAILINVARGALLDEAALVLALREGRIAGAGLDVFEQEPLASTSPLLRMSNVLLTPHIAGVSLEAHARRAHQVASQVLQVMAGERPPHLVNPSAWQHRR